MAPSKAGEEARRLGAATSPSPGHNNDSVSSSTALAGFSGRVSSRVGERKPYRLWVVKCHCDPWFHDAATSARFFVAYDNTMYCENCSNVHYNESENYREVAWSLNPDCSTRCERSTEWRAHCSALAVPLCFTATIPTSCKY